MNRELPHEIRNLILKMQRYEITEYLIYHKLSESAKGHNRGVLKTISEDEFNHYTFWKEYTGRDMAPSRLRVWKYFFFSRILGITFGIKLMEKGEEVAQQHYEGIAKHIPAAREILKDEDQHEKTLIELLDEERLAYVGSIILGLNDALVELLGALAGFTFTLQNTGVIAMVGLIMGIAASLSMAASEYLSTKSEQGSQNPVKASIYTGSTYVGTVMFLIFPYLVLRNPYVCLAVTLVNALLVIFMFTYYISVVKDISFKRRFLEMALIGLGIAAFTFAIGFFMRMFFSIDI